MKANDKMANTRKLERNLPAEKSYEFLLAEEELILDAQITIQRILNEKDICQAELARVLGVSESYISQMLSDSARNLTLRTVARVMHALGEKAHLTTKRYANGFKEPVRPYQSDADFGPWGEIVTLEDASDWVKRDWLAQDWAANENHISAPELADAA